MPAINFDELLEAAFASVVRYWSGIDGIAAGMLALGRADGEVPPTQIGKLVDYFRSNAWDGREPSEPAPEWDRVKQLVAVIATEFPDVLLPMDTGDLNVVERINSNNLNVGNSSETLADSLDLHPPKRPTIIRSAV